MPNDVEVLIVSFNSGPEIDRCLRSIAVVAPSLRVAVREHGDDPGAFEQLRADIEALPMESRVDRDPSNPGFGAGCNALASGSTASWLLFLNPDAELLKWPWGHTLPPRGRILGASMIDSGHPGEHAGVSYRVRDEVARSWLRRRGPRPTGEGIVSGAALLVDRNSFARIGGFDESYFMYYEDIDLCLRANALGIPTEIATDWWVRHSRAHSTRSRFAESLVWSYESGCRFHDTHGSNAALYRGYVIADSVLRSIIHLIRRDRPRSRAYASLARRAAGDLIHRRDATAPNPDASV